MSDISKQRGNLSKQTTPMAVFFSELKQHLEKKQSSISESVPSGTDPIRYMNTALVFASQVDHINGCTMASVVASILKGAALGLDFSLQECYLIPRGTTCTFLPDYKGLLRLALQHPDVRDIQAHCVYENDEFEWELDKIPHHKCKPFSPNRGEIVGSYAYAILKDNHVQCIAMSKKEIEASRAQSAAPNSIMWKNFYSEGAKKVVLRRLTKTIPKSTALGQAIADDDAAEYPRDTPKVASARKTSAERLLERLEETPADDVPSDMNIIDAADPVEVK